MSQEIDFKLDGEIKESSDEKLFSISKARAEQSKVWKDMIRVRESHKAETVTLSEDSELLIKLFEALNVIEWLVERPIELQNLKAVSFVALLEAAGKYQAEIVSTFFFWGLGDSSELTLSARPTRMAFKQMDGIAITS